MPKTIGNPLSWMAGAIGAAAGYATVAVAPSDADPNVMPQVRRLATEDLWRALRKGWEDMAAFRSDVVFVCLLYPVIGGLLLAIAAQGNFIHLLFPVLSGFALVGPVAALGLYEMSRRREAGQPTNWLALLDVMKSPRFGRIVMLSFFNVVIFLVWILLAELIFTLTIGAVPTSYAAFLTEVMTTPAGWALAVIGTAAGFVLALVVLAVGALPALLGLVLALPLLGHATWHLYRAAVV